MTDLRPVIFLDVDGVITTAVDPASDEPDPRAAWIDDAAVVGVRYNPEIVTRIHELAAVAEFRWLTAWTESARTELAPALGVPDFPAVPLQEHRYPELDWKHSAVLAQLTDERHRQVLLLCDEPDYLGAYDQLVPYALEDGIPFLAVRPTISDGIAEPHMLRIRALFERL